MTKTNGSARGRRKGMRAFRIPTVQEALAKGYDIDGGKPMPVELTPESYGGDVKAMLDDAEFVSILREQVDTETGDVLGQITEEQAADYAQKLSEYGFSGRVTRSRSGNSWTIWKDSGPQGFDPAEFGLPPLPELKVPAM